jgi:hypothetical protein
MNKNNPLITANTLRDLNISELNLESMLFEAHAEDLTIA